MKSLMDLVDAWRKDFRENRGGSADCASCGCANELEGWIKDLAADLDQAEEQPVGLSLGPLYSVGINVARDEIRRLIGVKKEA